MSVYRVIDKLESTVKEGVWLPFGGRIVNADRVLDLVEKLRGTLPDEVNRAKQVTKDRERVLEQAKEEAQALVAEAGEVKARAESDSALVETANRKADTIIAAAQARAEEIRRGADDYADQVLSSLDVSLAKALAAVHKGRQALAASVPASSNGGVKRELATSH